MDPAFAVAIIGRAKTNPNALKHRLVIVRASGQAGAHKVATEAFLRDFPDFEVWNVLVEPTKEN